MNAHTRSGMAPVAHRLTIVNPLAVPILKGSNVPGEPPLGHSHRGALGLTRLYKTSLKRTLSVSHFSRFKYSLREARMARSITNGKGCPFNSALEGGKKLVEFCQNTKLVENTNYIHTRSHIQ